MDITPEYLKELLDYDPTTGKFVWRARNLRLGLERLDRGWNKRFFGKPVASRCHRHGHLQIGLHCRNYMAHRIAWAIYYGQWPELDLDHINGIPSDNRIENLRLATVSENLCNAKIRIDNTSGVKGVSWVEKEQKWQAYITKDKKTVPLGRYSSFEVAVSVRRNAEAELHGEFARKS